MSLHCDWLVFAKNAVTVHVCGCTGTTDTRPCCSPVTTLCRFQRDVAEVCALRGRYTSVDKTLIGCMCSAKETQGHDLTHADVLESDVGGPAKDVARQRSSASAASQPLTGNSVRRFLFRGKF